jgi:hypothetical protein
MAIDLNILLSGASTSQATMSPMAMYKKLQKLAEENKAGNASDEAATKAKAIAREMNNAAIRVRNTQYRDDNARVLNDMTYYANRVKTATTSTELVNDDRFLKVLATANGFEDMYVNDRQKLRDILLSDLNDPASVARSGTMKDYELARKYNFGATGDQLDANGNTVGWDADGKMTNDATVVVPLPAGLARIRSLTIDINGRAMVTEDQKDPADDGKLIYGANMAERDLNAFKAKAVKPLLSEEQAPAAAKAGYEYAGEEFDKFRNRSDVKREIEYYRENIGSIQTVDDFFKNYRLVKFALDAFDLGSEAQYTGKIRKILESDLTDVDSLANRFQDPRFKKMAETLGIGALGTVKLKLSFTTDDLVSRYEQVQYEKHLDEQAPGVRAAIEFERRIKDVTQTVQLLGDSVLRDVVLTANSIPQEIAYQEVDSQITALEKRIDVKALVADQNEISKMVTRYLTFKSSDTGTGSSGSYLLNLFG